MRFCLTQWSATRFYGRLSVSDSRPLPSEKNSPFAAQLKIAFRRFLFCDEILLAGTAVPFTNKEFTGKSLLTLFCSVLKALKIFFLSWCTIFHELKSVTKAKIAQNNSQVSEGGITVKPFMN